MNKRYRGHFARRPPRRTSGADSNTDDLVSYATALGMTVAIIEDRDGCPEFLIGGWGVVRLAEGKTAKGKLRERQEKWRKRWRGPPPLLWRTRTDVEKTAMDMRAESDLRRWYAMMGDPISDGDVRSEEDLDDRAVEGET